MDQQSRPHPALAVNRWTLNEVLAWIATRRPEAVLDSEGFAALCVWMALHPGEYPYPEPSSAWGVLADAMTEGLRGIGTSVRMSWNGGMIHHVVGVRFPPEDQPGAALDYVVYRELPSVIRPAGSVGAHSWVEFHDLTFRREDVVARFPDLLAKQIDKAPSEQVLEPHRMQVAGQHEASPPEKEVTASPTRRGRPTVYPWYNFEAEALRKLEYEGGVGAVTGFLQANLERHMAEWCSNNWERQPAESTVRDRVANVVRSYEAGKGR